MYEKINQGMSEGLDVRKISEGIDKEDRINYEQFLNVAKRAMVCFLLSP